MMRLRMRHPSNTTANTLGRIALSGLAILFVNATLLAQATTTSDRQKFAEASRLEKKTVQSLLKGESWPRRALAAMRLERYDCPETQDMLLRLLADDAWQVRAFATRTLGRRRVPAQAHWFATEDEPRVLRTALRHRYKLDLERVGRGVRFLARADNLQDRLLAAEIGIASGDAALAKLAGETTRKIILRMRRIEAGALSPRLAMITGAPDLRRQYRWQQWLRKIGRRFEVHPAYAVPEATEAPLPPGFLARLDPDRFAAMESYIDALSDRHVDLAICLDCTASMWGEIAEAQGGIDDMMLFVGDVVGSLRVGIVGYRDRRDEFETKAWDFTSDINEARRRLWSLRADGGGDTPEAVYPALRLAYTQFSWLPSHTKVLVLVGDAPPRVGTGTLCISLAERGAKIKLTTHVIQADAKEVKHFPQIAEAGGGRCVNHADGDSLIAQITGLTLGDRFQEEFGEFFETYLQLCR